LLRSEHEGASLGTCAGAGPVPTRLFTPHAAGGK
jgi:hypothetical protein